MTPTRTRCQPPSSTCSRPWPSAFARRASCLSATTPTPLTLPSRPSSTRSARPSKVRLLAPVRPRGPAPSGALVPPGSHLGDGDAPARDDLRARQLSLVAALVAGAGAPDGMDAGRVEIQAAALVRKRGRSVARAWPELAVSLGSAYGRYFRDYAATTAGPPPGGSAADGAAFASYLLRHHRESLPRDAVRAARQAGPTRKPVVKAKTPRP